MFANACRFTSGSNGTADFSDGTAIQGFRNLTNASLSNGSTYSYRAENTDRTEWEDGLGTYDSGAGTLIRTTVYESNTGSKINFTLAPVVFLTLLKQDLGTVVSLASDTDGALTANSDTRVPTQKAVKTYADTKQSTLGFTPEDVSNKDTDGTLASNSDTKYPSQKAVKTYADTKQSADATLTALAGVTTSSDTLIYATGSDTFSTTTLTTFGRSLIDDADASAAKTTLGLVIGTNVQAWDTDLDALAGLSSTGLISRSGSGTAVVRTLTAPAAGISVSNGDGVSGNPTLALANDLSALEGLSSSGFAARTGTDTWAIRTFSTSTGLSITNGSGGGNPNISFNISALTEDTTPDPTADFLLEYDSSASGHKITKITSFTREKLAANRTYYVRTDGSDSNTGLANTSGGAFLTLQKAYNTILTLDLAGTTVTVQVGDGTYTAGLSATTPALGGPVVFQGNSGTPSNVVISTTSAHAFYIANSTRLTVQNLQVQTTTGGRGVYADYAAVVTIRNLVFGACADRHLDAERNGIIVATANYSITGNAQIHLNCEQGGIINIAGRTITLTGTPAFSTAFLRCLLQAQVIADGITFSGSATGTRYTISYNATVYVGGAGSTYFPGNASGLVASGGQYA